MVDLVTPSNNKKYPGPPWRIALHVSLGALLTFAVQTVTLIVVLTQMHSDIGYLKIEHAGMDARLMAIDSGGTRELALTRQRQMDFAAGQATQDVRINDIYDRIGKIEQRTSENRFWIDQLREAIKAFSHPRPAQ